MVNVPSGISGLVATGVGVRRLERWLGIQHHVHILNGLRRVSDPCSIPARVFENIPKLRRDPNVGRGHRF